MERLHCPLYATNDDAEKETDSEPQDIQAQLDKLVEDTPMFSSFDSDRFDKEALPIPLFTAAVVTIGSLIFTYYLFDIGDDWRFEIRKSRRKPRQAENGVKYPRVIHSIGPNPLQYPVYEEG